MTRSRIAKYFESSLIFHSPKIYKTEAKNSAYKVPDIKSRRNSRVLTIF